MIQGQSLAWMHFRYAIMTAEKGQMGTLNSTWDDYEVDEEYFYNDY